MYSISNLSHLVQSSLQHYPWDAITGLRDTKELTGKLEKCWLQKYTYTLEEGKNQMLTWNKDENILD